MIRLHANYGRKVPGESQYSSCQASASIDFEVSDSEIGQIRTRLSGAWAMLRDAVDAELARQQSGNNMSNRLQGQPFDPALPQGPRPDRTNSNFNPNAMPPQNGNGNGRNGNGYQPYPNQQVGHGGGPSNGASGNGSGFRGSNGNGTNGNGAPPSVHNGHGAAPQANSTHTQDARATKKQVGFLFAMARRTRNWTADQTKAWVSDQHGCAINDLTKKQASALIDALQGRS